MFIHPSIFDTNLHLEPRVPGCAGASPSCEVRVVPWTRRHFIPGPLTPTDNLVFPMNAREPGLNPHRPEEDSQTAR